MVLNINNFYKEFDNIYDKLEIVDDNIYCELIKLYEKYAFNYKNNDNLVSDLKIINVEITHDGLLKNVEEL
tara:strand:- start:5694 stop:5906 length:213 start_codon:yes stop_codon:yes gene_type:complete